MPRKRALTGFSKSSVVSKRARRLPTPANMSIPRILRTLVQKPITVVHRGIGYLPINSTLGWNSLGNSLVIGFTQNQAYYSINGSVYSTFTGGYGNASSLTSVYDQFRPVKIQAEIYGSFNDVGVNQSTYSFPLIYGVIDEDDGQTIPSIAEAISYSNMKTFQLIAGKKMTLTLNNPSTTTAVDSITAGLSVVNGNSRRPWLSCASNSAEFGWFKFYLDTTNMTVASAALGQVSIMFTVIYEYRNLR